MDVGGIVLAGGRSTRMGQPKAGLDWHGVPLVTHLASIVRRGSGQGPVVVVRAPGQELPALPLWVEVAEDRVSGRGPLQGLLEGLEALAGRAEAVFLASTDVPFLRPAFVRAVLSQLDARSDAAVPHVAGFRQPLLAAYRVSAAPHVSRCLDDGLLRPGMVFADRLRVVDADALLGDPGVRREDPELRSVENVNTPDEYRAALGWPLPQIEISTFGVARLRARSHSAVAAVVRLGQAAAAVGIELDGHVVAAVNGEQIVADPLFPLVAGDTVAFIGADGGG